MKVPTRPRVIVSKCLGFAPCRYNGVTINDAFVQRLQPHVTFLPVCPEMEIGLGAPRDPVRIVLMEDQLRLMQPATGADLTDRMRAFADTFLDSLTGVDGFLLKTRSPSCGTKDVKVYPGDRKVGSVAKKAGFFGGAVVGRFSHLAVEDEGRSK
ncbi:MAG: DUF523 domain-containing protein, partial [Chloroflexota bacterium]|nr:DUF523 domain-containing protein [Chloroflexota bacterium]